MMMAMESGMGKSMYEKSLLSAEASKLATAKELTPQQSADRIEDSIDFLEEIWETDEDVQDHIDEDDWKDFMDSIYEDLKNLQDQLD